MSGITFNQLHGNLPPQRQQEIMQVSGSWEPAWRAGGTDALDAPTLPGTRPHPSNVGHAALAAAAATAHQTQRAPRGSEFADTTPMPIVQSAQPPVDRTLPLGMRQRAALRTEAERAARHPQAGSPSNPATSPAPRRAHPQGTAPTNQQAPAHVASQRPAAALTHHQAPIQNIGQEARNEGRRTQTTNENRFDELQQQIADAIADYKKHIGQQAGAQRQGGHPNAAPDSPTLATPAPSGERSLEDAAAAGGLSPMQTIVIKAIGAEFQRIRNSRTGEGGSTPALATPAAPQRVASRTPQPELQAPTPTRVIDRDERVVKTTSEPEQEPANIETLSMQAVRSTVSAEHARTTASVPEHEQASETPVDNEAAKAAITPEAYPKFKSAAARRLYEAALKAEQLSSRSQQRRGLHLPTPAQTRTMATRTSEFVTHAPANLVEFARNRGLIEPIGHAARRAYQRFDQGGIGALAAVREVWSAVRTQWEHAGQPARDRQLVNQLSYVMYNELGSPLAFRLRDPDEPKPESAVVAHDAMAFLKQYEEPRRMLVAARKRGITEAVLARALDTQFGQYPSHMSQEEQMRLVTNISNALRKTTTRLTLAAKKSSQSSW